MSIRERKLLFYSGSIASLVISLLFNGGSIKLNLEYKNISWILIILSIITNFTFWILSLKKEHFVGLSLIGTVSSTNICSLSMYLLVVSFLYPQSKLAGFVYLFCYFGIEAILFIRRIVVKNQSFLKSLYENRTNKFAKQDIILSLVLGITIIGLTKILDGQPQNLPADYYDDIFHTIYMVPLCIMAITIHIHTLAKYIFVERKKQIQSFGNTKRSR